MSRSKIALLALLLAAPLVAAGCASPYHADRGALFGGLLGAGTGALVGSAVGNVGAGAAIGAGVGALSGAAVGSSLDDIEARNRAEIAARLGRPVAAQPVTIDEVIGMSRAGVEESLIANHVRVHGVAAPLTANDLIVLQQQGVSPRVVAAMQQPPQPPAAVYATPVYAAPAPVIIEEYHYGPYWRPHHYYHHCPPPHPHGGVAWGVAVGG